MSEIDSFCSSCRTRYKSDTPINLVSRKKVRNDCILGQFNRCKEVSGVTTQSVCLETFNVAFSLQGMCKSLPDDIDLCRIHYYRYTKILNTRACDVCIYGIARGSKRYYCHNQDLTLLCKRAKQINADVTLSNESVLCPSCYRFIHCKLSAKSLDDLVGKFEQEACKIACNSECDDHEKHVVDVCKSLCAYFQNNEAALLVDIHKQYSSSFSSSPHKSEGDSNEAKPLSRRKLLSELLDRFDNLLEVNVTNSTKEGKLLMFKKCDIKTVLHKAVYKLHVMKGKEKQNKSDDTDSDFKVGLCDDEERFNLHCASLDFNNRLNVQAKKINEYFVNNPYEIKSVEIENLLSFIDVQLWNTFFIMTANSVEKREVRDQIGIDSYLKLPMAVDDEKGKHNRKRFMRRIICILHLQFVLNDEYNLPLHIIHADVVKRYSNSSRLLKVLNNAGFCSSNDTLERFLEKIAIYKQKNCIKNLNENSFTIVSIDNIDCLSPYAIMSACGEKERSWHGTSVMAQQPQPKQDCLFPNEKITYNQRFTLLKVFGDGRCFYRCIAAHSSQLLRTSIRNLYGKPTEGNNFSFETMLADKILNGISAVLKDNVHVLRKLPETIGNLFLEKQSGIYYENFDVCLHEQSKPGTYACTLQILAAAFAIRTQICIYEFVDQNYELIATYPHDFYQNSDPIHLLYHPDCTGEPGHFDLLLEDKLDLEELIDLDCDVSSVFDSWQSLNLSRNTSCQEVDFHLVVHEYTNLKTNSKKNRRRLSSKYSRNVPKQQSSEPFFKTFLPNQLTLDLFCPSGTEEMATAELFGRVFLYVLERYTILENEIGVKMPSIKAKLAAEDLFLNPKREKSKFSFIEVYNEKADCTATIKMVLDELHHTFQVSKKINHLFIVGDLKTYEYIMNAKRDRGKSMDWVVPYVGDWHVMKNFQIVIMKIFWDAGLKELAKVVHKGASVLNIKNCQNFRHTHRFILHIYEALHLYQLNCFLKFRQDASVRSNCPLDNQAIMSLLTSVVEQLNNADRDFTNIGTFIDLQNDLKKKLLPGFWNEYLSWCEDMRKQHTIFSFWDNFLRRDVFAYLQLFLALRSGNWNWRQAAIKRMAALFHAFDHQNYGRWLPIHLSQLYALPDYVLLHLRNGSFVSNIKGVNFNCVGFDEAHEMMINRMCKQVIVRSTPQNIGRITSTLEFQAELVYNYATQVAKPTVPLLQRDFADSIIRIEQDNIHRYYCKFLETKVFHDFQSSNLYHAFTNIEASPNASVDLQRYGDVGRQSYIDFIKTRILRDASITKAPLRKKHMKTFASHRKPTGKAASLEKEKKMITKYYKRQIQALKLGKQLPFPNNPQFLHTPRAICTEKGFPRKGAKSTVYGTMQTRYAGKEVVSESIIFRRADTCLVAEGMNIIYKGPKGQRTFDEYAKYLVQTVLVPYLRNGYNDIRVLFDQSGTQGPSPKIFEQMRRDGKSDNESDDADLEYTTIEDSTELPKLWSPFLNIRKNKRLLCSYLVQKLPAVMKPLLKPNYMFIASGSVTVCASPEGISNYRFNTNHVECDTQVWLHVYDTKCNTVHVRSIDRDLGMIGIGLFHKFQGKQIYIEYQQTPAMYVNINCLVQSLSSDTDLAGPVESASDICKIIQTTFICSGCDFVSYFYGKTKTKFYETLFQYANFITNTRAESVDTFGSLIHTQRNTMGKGLMSFYRLIGSVYFKLNRAALRAYESPEQIFNKFGNSGLSILEQHSSFLGEIRQACSLKGSYEDELLPSDDALRYHWNRCCWVSAVWESSLQTHFMYPDVSDYGWKVGEAGITVIWDSPDNLRHIDENIGFLTRGCGCPKSRCTTRSCKCVKAGKFCVPGVGCSCVNCSNIEPSSSAESLQNVELAALDTSSENENIMVELVIEPDDIDNSENESEYDDDSDQSEVDSDAENNENEVGEVLISSDTEDTNLDDVYF